MVPVSVLQRNWLLLKNIYFICLFTYLFDWVLVATSGGQSIGASASASVLPMNVQG